MSPSRARLGRRTTLAAAAGSAVLASLVIATFGSLPSDRGASTLPPPRTSAPTSPPTDSSTDSSTEVSPTFDCPQELEVLHSAPPVPDLAEQRRVVRRLATLDSVQVRHAAPSALGVVALVQDDTGDADYWADPAVVDRLARAGVAHTYEWDAGAADSGADAADQVRQVLLWELDPAMQDVRRAVRGMPGSAGLAFWPQAGAIVVQWKTPVPISVRNLAGTRADGVRIDVRAATYSDADVRRAQRRLSVWLRDTGRRRDWSSASPCADGSGLVVGMVPEVAGEQGLAEALSEAVGMPVLVVPEDPPVDLTPGPEDRPD